jgi:hypothetical protein
MRRENLPEPLFSKEGNFYSKEVSTQQLLSFLNSPFEKGGSRGI